MKNYALFVVMFLSLVFGFGTAMADKEGKTPPAQGLDQACIQELGASTKSCKMDKSHLKQLSPDCLKQIEAKHLPAPDTSCGKELQVAGQTMMSKIMECRNKHISARCRRQIDTTSKKLQEQSSRCANEMKRIFSICGSVNATNEECYKNHRSELKAACGE